ncbi:MAG: conjugal transfer protein TraX [Clostridia bacterium]|nr:conjugal transfer protein TraX [Clostridia bacterium]
MNKSIKRSLPTDTPFARLPFGGLTSNVLRVIAVMLMVTDHIWATYMSFGNWMTYLGRLAFPIFAFQLAEGFLHTSDVKRYAKRLFLFALVSEIPFDLFCVSTWLNPFHQNVMFTLLLGLFAIMTIDNAKKNRKPKNIVVSILLLGAIFVAAYFGFVDYGIWGVATVLVFYLLRDFPFAWIAQLVSMVVIHVFLFEGQVFSLELFGRTFEISTQGFAVFSLVPIWLYNGKKGRPSKVMQYGSYAFYPVHMIVLYLIKHFA